MQNRNIDQFETQNFADKFFPKLRSIHLKKKSGRLMYELSISGYGKDEPMPFPSPSQNYETVGCLVFDLCQNLERFQIEDSQIVLDIITNITMFALNREQKVKNIFLY